MINQNDIVDKAEHNFIGMSYFIGKHKKGFSDRNKKFPIYFLNVLHFFFLKNPYLFVVCTNQNPMKICVESVLTLLESPSFFTDFFEKEINMSETFTKHSLKLYQVNHLFY